MRRPSIVSASAGGSGAKRGASAVSEVSPPAKGVAKAGGKKPSTPKEADDLPVQSAKKKKGSLAKKAEGGGGCKASKGGRPVDDPILKSRHILKNFEESKDSDSQFFGELYKNFKRTIDGVHLRFSEIFKAADEETHDMVVIDYKRYCAMMTVLKAIYKSGMESHGAYLAYKQQRDFLLTSPVAAAPFPAWMVLRMHMVGLESATPLQFWTNSAMDALLSAGVELEQIEEQQGTLIADRMVGAFAKPTFDECKAQLVAYFGEVLGPPQMISLVGSNQQTALWIKTLISLPSTPLAKAQNDLSAAVQALKTEKAFATVLNFPAGRELQKRAVAMLSTLEASLSEHTRIAAMVTEITMMFKDGASDPVGIIASLSALGVACYEKSPQPFGVASWHSEHGFKKFDLGLLGLLGPYA